MLSIKNILAAALAAVSIVTISNSCYAQNAETSAAPFNAAEAHAAVDRLADQLEANFIYPDVGASYAKMLRAKVSGGEYSKFSNAQEFARKVTADLQAVHPEGHLRLQPPTVDSAGKPKPPSGARVNGIGRSGWLAPRTAYMSYHGFSGDRAQYDEVISEIRRVLDGFAGAKTLIIDARMHPGGGLDDMDVMFSYFFDKPTTLVMMDTRLEVDKRGGNPLAGHPTLEDVSGPAGIVRKAHVVKTSIKDTSLGKAAIFLLVSKNTASAGEHLALSLKRTGRATLVGETTRGGGALRAYRRLGRRLPRVHPGGTDVRP